MKSGLITLSLLFCIASGANPQCSSDTLSNSLLAIWNNYFTEYPSQEHSCSCGLYEDTLALACGRWNIDDYEIIHDDFLTDNPTSTLFDWENMRNCRIFLGGTTGYARGTDVEYYKTEAARDAALDAYANGHSDSELEAGYAYGAYVICWKDEGIRNHFSMTPNNYDMLMVLGHSESRALMNDYIDWPSIPEQGKGPAFVGYNADQYPELTTKCYNDRALIYSLGCFYWPGTGSPLSHAVENTIFIVFEGNLANQMSCRESCSDWLARFVDVGACGGRIYWAVTGEDVGSRYSVLGYRSFGRLEKPDTLARVRGLGADGYDRVRTYSCVGSAAHVAFRVIETGNDEGMVAASHVFTRDEAESDGWRERLTAQRDLVLESADHSEASEVVYELVTEEGRPRLVGRSTAETERAGRVLDIPPLETDCGDLVIYGRTAEEVQRVKEHAEQYKARDGERNIRARCFVGSENPLDAQYAFMSTWSGNYAWFEYCRWYDCGREYPVWNPGPMLILVGDADRIHHLAYEDDEVHTCMAAHCRSDQDITDYYAEGQPWANVWRIPSENLTETDSACRNFDIWNLGAEFNTSAALFCGNEYGDGYNDHLAQGMQAIAEQYEAEGREATLYAESEHAYAECQSIGPQALQGVGELWVQGLETAAWWLTSFLTEDNVTELHGNPLFIHAPSCQTAAVWWNENYQTTVVEYCMFEKSVAGAIGHLNGDWSFRHEYWRDLWKETYLNAEPGRPMDLLAWDALEQLRERHPRYARGVELLGGYLLSPPRNPAGVNAPKEPVFTVGKETTPDATRLIFSLPERAKVDLSIHDVGGRTVRSCLGNDLREGVHSYTWDLRNDRGDDVASGIYFAILIAAGQARYRRSIKLNVLR